jgi:hypothetical protein
MADGNILFRSVLVLAAGVALIMIIFHYNKTVNREHFEALSPLLPNGPSAAGHNTDYTPSYTPGADIMGGGATGQWSAGSEPSGSSEDIGDLLSRAAPLKASGSGTQASIKPEDLLPKLGNSREENQFAQLHPVGQGDVQGVNFLDAGSLIGQTTSLMRNANHQLRADPPIEKKNVSPWMMSTITADTATRGLEIGTL